MTKNSLKIISKLKNNNISFFTKKKIGNKKQIIQKSIKSLHRSYIDRKKRKIFFNKLWLVRLNGFLNKEKKLKNLYFNRINWNILNFLLKTNSILVNKKVSNFLINYDIFSFFQIIETIEA
uniref:ribosomal protein L20 n=1 Tax=Prototheca moriformis TaxID=183676 RepID=UPI003003A5F4